MAGSLYRSGQQAVTEIRESYAQVRAKGPMDSASGHGMVHIPGAFPDVAIAWHNEEQLILFPCYAKRHVRRRLHRGEQFSQTGVRDEDYWNGEWERTEDDKAVVDVNVHGWIYSSPTLPLSRRNRMLVGLARQLSGIALPRPDLVPGGPGSGHMQSNHQMNEAIHDQQRIAREAARIEQKGQEEKRVAYRGGYSEKPTNGSTGRDSTNGSIRRVDSLARDGGLQSRPTSAPPSPELTPRTTQSTVHLSDAELTAANSNLMARIAPFMTNPLVAQPMTLFFYNETQSQSRTVQTNEAGHFIVQAALDFIPTHVRVLANEKLSASQQVSVVEPGGVSLISDVDDTVKHSNISAGAREIFRNTFVRDLDDLAIDGVREWYGLLHKLGVGFHYCSNSPWQLFPVLTTFFNTCGLPPGSLHLKQYSGMLQGIFEPVAERKRTTLDRLMRDFPQRKFLLVGDSGEADLEVYTELALAYPGRVLAIFIRDVTTPEKVGYFDASFELPQRKVGCMTLDDDASVQGKTWLSTPVVQHQRASSGPSMGTLIDFVQEPEQVALGEAFVPGAAGKTETAKTPNTTPNATTHTDTITRKAPPPRPVKPAALRSAQQDKLKSTQDASGWPGRNTDLETPPPLPERKITAETLHTPPQKPAEPLHAQSQTESPSRRGTEAPPPPPPPPRRRMGKKSSARLVEPRAPSDNDDADSDAHASSSLALSHSGASRSSSSLRGRNASPARSDVVGVRRRHSPSRVRTPPAGSGSPTTNAPQGGGGSSGKKLELWRRRLVRAQEQLDGVGVGLYTWRRGQDVIEEAAAIVEEELQAQRQGRVGAVGDG